MAPLVGLAPANVLDENQVTLLICLQRHLFPALAFAAQLTVENKQHLAFVQRKRRKRQDASLRCSIS